MGSAVGTSQLAARTQGSWPDTYKILSKQCDIYCI